MILKNKKGQEIAGTITSIALIMVFGSIIIYFTLVLPTQSSSRIELTEVEKEINIQTSTYFIGFLKKENE